MLVSISSFTALRLQEKYFDFIAKYEDKIIIAIMGGVGLFSYLVMTFGLLGFIGQHILIPILLFYPKKLLSQ